GRSPMKSCAGKPAAVARTTCGEVAPTLSTVLATPLELVVLCAVLSPPPPVWIVQSTRTPGTGQAFASRAVTLRGAGSGLLTYQFCASPLLTSCVAVPGVQGPVPPPPSPPHARASTPTANVNR